MGAVYSEPKRAETREQKIARLRTLLDARCKPDGTPKLGFRRNVAMVRAELARLEALGAKTAEK